MKYEFKYTKTRKLLSDFSFGYDDIVDNSEFFIQTITSATKGEIVWEGIMIDFLELVNDNKGNKVCQSEHYSVEMFWYDKHYHIYVYEQTKTPGWIKIRR